MKRSRRLLSGMLPLLLVFTLAACDSDNPEDPVTIVDVATDAGFNTLVAAVEAAELVATLESDGPFTVFAPNEAAFAALPDGTLDELLMPANKQALTDILTYHVVAGAVPASDVVNLTSATTVNGETVSIEVVNGSVFVNGAQVLQTDIPADNGIIHVIDAVLLPPAP